MSIDMVPISSRKSVPPLATSNSPFFALIAEVNAPLTWPKSEDSSRSDGIAPVFTGTKGLSRRVEFWWMALAMSSLPVPDSPWIRMVERLGATCATVSNRRSMGSDLPMMFSKLYRCLSVRLSWMTSASALWRAMAVRMSASSFSLSHGFCTKFSAPARMASTTLFTVPKAVIMMTGSSGFWPVMRGSRSMPDSPGNERSSSSRSKVSRERASRPVGPSVASVTSNPSSESRTSSDSRIMGSSSMMRMRAMAMAAAEGAVARAADIWDSYVKGKCLSGVTALTITLACGSGDHGAPAGTGTGTAGISSRKVVPWPGVEATLILPPCSCRMP